MIVLAVLIFKAAKQDQIVGAVLILVNFIVVRGIMDLILISAILEILVIYLAIYLVLKIPELIIKLVIRVAI